MRCRGAPANLQGTTGMALSCFQEAYPKLRSRKCGRSAFLPSDSLFCIIMCAASRARAGRAVVGRLHDDVARGEHRVVVVDQHRQLLLHAHGPVRGAPRVVHEHAAARAEGQALSGSAIRNGTCQRNAWALPYKSKTAADNSVADAGTPAVLRNR